MASGALRTGWRFAWHNLRFAVAGGYVLPGRHRLAPDAVVRPDFFGICVASSADPGCDDYVLESLRDLGIRQVRLDVTHGSEHGDAERFLGRLLEAGLSVCLHLVQPFPEACAMHSEQAQSAWRHFVSTLLGRYGSRLDCVEIGSTCNRRKWSGYSLSTFMTAWRIAHSAAVACGVRIAAPNVTDFEPVYNVGLLGLAGDAGILPAIHTDNLFAERATEPEAYDHKILGRPLAPWIKYNTVKKAALLRKITRWYGIEKLMCMHVAWSERRIRRLLADPWQKQADYLQRYLCLLAASGAFDRVYWGPMIGQREGLIDDGTRVYPDLPHVTWYGKAQGRVADYRRRPAFGALRTVVRMLSGARFVGDHSSSPQLRILEFTKDGSVLHVVWTTNGDGFDPASWYDAGTLAQARVTGRDGETLPCFPCIIGERPVFLEWRHGLPSHRSSPPGILKRHRFHSDPAMVLRRVAGPPRTGVVATTPADGDPQRFAEALDPARLEQAADRTDLRKGRNTVWACALPVQGNPRVVVKRSNVRRLHRRLLDRCKPGRALRSWNGACELLRRGIATPRPLAFFEDARTPRSGAGYYICEALSVNGSVRDAFHAFAKGAIEYEEIPKEAFYRALAAFIRRMHARGVFFRDLSSGNILVQLAEGGTPCFSLVDTTRAVFFRHGICLRQQLSDLKRVCHRLTWPERRAFLAHYFEEGAAASALRVWLVFGLYDAKHWWKQRVKRGFRPSA